MARFIPLDKEVWVRPGLRNYCTVIALAITCNADLDRALAHAARCGRKKNRGYWPLSYFPWRRRGRGLGFAHQRFNGASVVKVTRPLSMTVATFLDRHKKGRFIVSVRGHSFAVVDGALHDWRPVRESRLITQVIELKVPRRRKKLAPVALAA